MRLNIHLSLVAYKYGMSETIQVPHVQQSVQGQAVLQRHTGRTLVKSIACARCAVYGLRGSLVSILKEWLAIGRNWCRANRGAFRTLGRLLATKPWKFLLRSIRLDLVNALSGFYFDLVLPSGLAALNVYDYQPSE